MNFSDALNLIKAGKRMARAGWNGKGMFVFQGLPRVEINADLGGVVTATDAAQYWLSVYSGPVLCLMDAKREIVAGWLASQTDMLADDWVEVGG